MSINVLPLLLVGGQDVPDRDVLCGAFGGVLFDVLGVGGLRVLGHAGLAFLGLFLLRLVGGCLLAAAVGRAHAREVDAELLGGAQQVVVLVAHLGARALLGD